MANRFYNQGAAFGSGPLDFQRANYWNPPMWGYGSRSWYGVPGYAGPYYGGAGYGYGSAGTFFDANPSPGFGGADLGLGTLEYANPNVIYGPRSFSGYATGASSGFRTRSFAGVGPTSYVRSEERIRDDINDRLTAHPNIDATDVQVEVDDGIVTLRGTVDSRAAKRTAGEIAETVYGVSDVRNELKIQSSGRMQQQQGESPSARSGAAQRRTARQTGS